MTAMTPCSHFTPSSATPQADGPPPKAWGVTPAERLRCASAAGNGDAHRAVLVLRRPVDRAPHDVVRLDPAQAPRADDVLVQVEEVRGEVVAVRRHGVAVGGQ